jgi:hypothetical protein
MEIPAIQIVFVGTHHGNAEMEAANGKAPELLFGRFIALHLRQSANSVPPKPTMKRRSRMMPYR